jgi:radical SAM superfamily enzyme YgiQ (UPF0313 family)
VTTPIVLAAINAKWIHPSLALRLLKANLGDLDRPGGCRIMEFAPRQSLAEKTAPILAVAPRILGLSVSIWNHRAVLELLDALERRWGPPGPPRPVVVLGGPELTGLPEDAELFRPADFVIRGEGEEVFPVLCRAVLKDPREAKRAYGKFLDPGPVDLAALKPAYDLYTPEDLRRKLIYVEASRGCPYACAYCQSALKRGSAAAREFPLEGFLENLDALLGRIRREGRADPGEAGGKARRTIKFLDRSFNVNPRRASRILGYCLAQTGDAGSPFQFHFEMTPSVFPGELRRTLSLFPPGSLRLEIGVQSLNPQARALVNRPFDPPGEWEVLRFLRRETAAVVHADLIAGLPGEDLASFGRGFDRLWMAGTGDGAAAPFEIQPGILKCLPGTPLRAMAEDGRFQVRYDPAPPYEVTATAGLPAKDMEGLKNFARFWELIVNRGPLPGLFPPPAPPGEPVFARFMELAGKLRDHFGRNWGIPREELRAACVSLAGR